MKRLFNIFSLATIFALLASAVGMPPAPAYAAASMDWFALGATPLNSGAYAIAASGTDMYVGGDFTNAGGDANAD
jgi:hypothetical protein